MLNRVAENIIPGLTWNPSINMVWIPVFTGMILCQLIMNLTIRI